MKRTILLALLTLAAGTAGAQSLGDLFKSLFGGGKEPAQTESTVTIPQSVVGTWIYREPAITYTGSDMLAALAVTGLHDQFASYYVKAGLTAGQGGITLRKNDKVRAEMAGHEIEGTYIYNATDGSLTFTGKIGEQTASVTGKVTVEEGMMTLLFDAGKTLEIAKSLSPKLSEDARIQQISAILKQYPGIMLGAKLSKR